MQNASARNTNCDGHITKQQISKVIIRLEIDDLSNHKSSSSTTASSSSQNSQSIESLDSSKNCNNLIINSTKNLEDTFNSSNKNIFEIFNYNCNFEILFLFF